MIIVCTTVQYIAGVCVSCLAGWLWINVRSGSELSQPTGLAGMVGCHARWDTPLLGYRTIRWHSTGEIEKFRAGQCVWMVV